MSTAACQFPYCGLHILLPWPGRVHDSAVSINDGKNDSGSSGGRRCPSPGGWLGLCGRGGDVEMGFRLDNLGTNTTMHRLTLPMGGQRLSAGCHGGSSVYPGHWGLPRRQAVEMSGAFAKLSRLGPRASASSSPIVRCGEPGIRIGISAYTCHNRIGEVPAVP